MIAIRIAVLLSLSLVVAGCMGPDEQVLRPTEQPPQLSAVIYADGVPVDIRPGSCPNRINQRSKGVISVAILATNDFDVFDIDVSSVLLYVFPVLREGIVPIGSYVEDVATPAGVGGECDCTEDGPDGYDDLVLKYRTQDIIATIGRLDSGDERRVIIHGKLLDGTEFGGIDCIVGVGNPQDPLYNYEIKFDRGRASGWFGGDDREGFGPRNVAVGQSVLITRDIVLESFAFSFSRHFDYSGAAEGMGHEVTLILDVRNDAGNILKSLPVVVPASYNGGWVSWDGIHLPVDENTMLIFTAYVLDGFTNGLSSGNEADPDAGYPDGVRYTKTGETGSGVQDWTGWSEHPWDSHFWLKGQIRTPGNGKSGKPSTLH